MRARQAVKLFAFVLFIWGILALISQTTAWRHLEYTGFDLLTILTAPRQIDLPIVIVGIDEPSFADLQRQWPWPRSYHARLVEALQRSGAAVIAFDVIFADPTTEEDDHAFAAAVQRAGNVLLAGDIALQQREQFELVMRVEPMHLLQNAGGRTGVSIITPDKDLVVRNIPRSEDAFWRVVVETYQQRTGRVKSDVSMLPNNTRVKYLGPDHTYNYVSYYQALDPENMLPPGIFKDKIVLVGFDVKVSAQPGMTRADTFASSFFRTTGWLTPGVEIQANFIANALLGRYIAESSRVYILLVTALALMLSLIGMSQWSPLRSTITVLILVTAIGILSWFLFWRHDTWLPITIAMLAPVLLYITQGATAFIQERRQRIAIRQAFQHYVPPQVVEEMIRHPEQLKLGGTRRNITLIFTDLQDFTAISESLAPEMVAKFLNNYFTEMTRIILNYGGTVDKFIGDAIMAFWGAPLEDPEQALHAVQAAIDMQQAMASMRSKLIDEGLPEVHMRIGIHSGEAIVGNMGSVDRFDYSALGDSVNLASRLEGINKQYGSEILLSEATAQQLGNRIPLMYVDRVVVKGKTEPIDIYTPQQDNEVRKLAEAAVNDYE